MFGQGELVEDERRLSHVSDQVKLQWLPKTSQETHYLPTALLAKRDAIVR